MGLRSEAEEWNITAGCESNRGNEPRKCDFTQRIWERTVLSWGTLSCEPSTHGPTGRRDDCWKEEVEMETMRFEHAQRLATKVRQQARQTCGNLAKGLASLCGKRGSQEGNKFPRCINSITVIWKVFDLKAAERFSLQRDEDVRIELLLGAPTAINCKVYPLNRKETDIL